MTLLNNSKLFLIKYNKLIILTYTFILSILYNNPIAVAEGLSFENKIDNQTIIYTLIGTTLVYISYNFCSYIFPDFSVIDMFSFYPRTENSDVTGIAFKDKYVYKPENVYAPDPIVQENLLKQIKSLTNHNSILLEQIKKLTELNTLQAETCSRYQQQIHDIFTGLDIKPDIGFNENLTIRIPAKKNADIQETGSFFVYENNVPNIKLETIFEDKS